MIILKKVLRQIIGITYKDYFAIHPKTKKSPNDPMFSKENRKNQSDDDVKKVPTKTVNTPLIKPVTEISDDEIIAKFTPKLNPSAFQYKMSMNEFKNNIHKMKADDVAWHILNSKVNVDDEDCRDAINNHFSVASSYSMSLLNPTISQREKNNIADFLIGNAGLSFVGSKSLSRFLEVCAKKGIISSKLIEKEKESTQHIDIATTYSSEQLLKLTPKKIQDNWSAVCDNPNLPLILINKMLKDKKVIGGLNALKSGYVDEYGFMGEMGERKDQMRRAKELLRNKNIPFNLLQDTLKKSLLDNFNTNNYKARGLASYFAEHPDINNPENIEMKNLCVSTYSKELVTMRDKDTKEANKYFKDDTEYGKNYKLDGIPENLRVTEKQFKAMFATRDPQDFYHWLEHPDVPNEILIQSLVIPDTEEADYSNERRTAYKKAIERKLLTDKQIVDTVKTNLNLHGDDVELIKKFAEHAYAMGKSTNDVPRYITKVPEEERKKIEDDMKKTSVHDEFDFEVSSVYTIDNEPHKDYSKVKEKIDNEITGVYHGTSYANAAGILADGVRVDTEARTGSMFGRGFYLASASSKAAQYAGENFSKNEGDGVVFVLNASLGNTNDMKYGRPVNDDMKYREHSSEEKKLIKEYKDKTGKPLLDKWHATHDSVTARAGQALDYDEYIVKDPSQIQIKKIVIVKKTPKIKK